MSKSMTHQDPDTRVSQKPARIILLEILKNRTGAVSRMEIYGVFQNQWQLPDGSAPSPQLIALSIIRHEKAGRILGHRPCKRNRKADVFTLTDSGLQYLMDHEKPRERERLLMSPESKPDHSFPWPARADYQRRPNRVHQQILQGMAA